MHTKLISYSQSLPLPLIEKNEKNEKSIQDLVCYCARVSNPSNQNNNATNENLIRYLIKNNHWSPFEMVNICIEIETTRDIARQILRHRSFSFQEFSQRYAVCDLGFEPKEARLQDLKNRQNSIELDYNPTDNENNSKNNKLIMGWRKHQEIVANAADQAYQWALENGIAKEQARAVLPEGMTLSRMYMNGTLRSWIHYIKIRTDPGTQKEHRLVALSCVETIRTIFPMIMEFVSA